MKRKDYIDYHGNTSPICPYCDHKLEDWHEDVSYIEDEQAQLTCPNCEKEFSCKTLISHSYTTVGDCKVHKLRKGYTSASPYTCQVCATEVYEFFLEGGKYQKYTKDQYEIIGPSEEEVI